jgi:hypothetical protein
MQPQDPAVLAEYETHLDIVDALTRAGWEPIPYMTASDPDISVERFGRGLFTLYSGAAGARRFSASVSWKELGHAAPGLRIRDFETGQALAFTVAGDQVIIPDIELSPEGVKILVIEAASAHSPRSSESSQVPRRAKEVHIGQIFRAMPAGTPVRGRRIRRLS